MPGYGHWVYTYVAGSKQILPLPSKVLVSGLLSLILMIQWDLVIFLKF